MADIMDGMDKHFEMAGIEKDTPKVEGDAGQQEQQTQSDSQGSKTDEQKTQDVKDPQSKSPGTDKQSGTSDGGNKQQQKKEEQKSSGPPDLVLQDGTVIKAGAERRWYEKFDLANRETKQLRTEVHNMRQSLNAATAKVEAFTTASQQAGVADPTQMADALRLYRDLGTDPVATIKNLLVEAKDKGYSIDGIGGGVDAAAIERLLDRRLGPTVERGTREAEEAEINRSAQAEANAFFQHNPDAKLHEPVLAALIAQNPTMSLFEIYSELKMNVIERGLDWSKPLATQVQAAAAGQQQQQQKTDPKPMINGNGIDVMGKGASEHDPAKIPAQADDFDEAIRAAMRENGHNV